MIKICIVDKIVVVVAYVNQILLCYSDVNFRLPHQTHQNKTFEFHMQPLPQFYQHYRLYHKTTYCFL